MTGASAARFEGAAIVADFVRDAVTGSSAAFVGMKTPHRPERGEPVGAYDFP